MRCIQRSPVLVAAIVNLHCRHSEAYMHCKVQAQRSLTVCVESAAKLQSGNQSTSQWLKWQRAALAETRDESLQASSCVENGQLGSGERHEQDQQYSAARGFSRRAAEFAVCRGIYCLPRKNAVFPVFCYIYV